MHNAATPATAPPRNSHLATPRFAQSARVPTSVHSLAANVPGAPRYHQPGLRSLGSSETLAFLREAIQTQNCGIGIRNTETDGYHEAPARTADTPPETG